MIMQAIGKYLVISALNDEEELKTSAGLYMGVEDKKTVRYKSAKLVSVGTLVDSALKVGQIVKYDVHNAFAMIIDGVSYSIIQERDVVLIFKE
jgi:co-chaperonin GroES (HSP10)